jgi:type II secretory pathway component PulF
MPKITKSQMAKMFGRLAIGYSAGLDIRALFAREAETGSSIYRRHANQIHRGITQGSSLADAMRSAHGYFPELATSIVQAGEKGGRLEDAFRRLSEHYENLVKFRNGFLISIAWPVFELVFAIAVIGALILVMGWLMGEDAIDWFGMGSAIGNFAFFVLVVFLLFSCLSLIVVGTMKGWFGDLPMRIARRIPLVGAVIEGFALSRMAWTMSIAENSGMHAVETARLAVQSTQNYIYQQAEPGIAAAVERGSSFYPAFKQSGVFPRDFLIYVENGETAGALAESMERASWELRTRAENNLKIIGTVGFVCTLLLVGLVMGTAIILMYKRLVIDQYNDLLRGQF